MEKINLSKEQLRKFLVIYQGLHCEKAFKGYTGIKDFVKRVGCVQYDPLNVVGRNIDLILQSRIENYETDMLKKLMYEDRELIDGWDKMMSIYCTEDWPYFERIRISRKSEIEGILERRNSSEAIAYVDRIKKYISENWVEYVIAFCNSSLYKYLRRPLVMVFSKKCFIHISFIHERH